jgi:hypothetical protein
MSFCFYPLVLTFFVLFCRRFSLPRPPLPPPGSASGANGGTNGPMNGGGGGPVNGGHHHGMAGGGGGGGPGQPSSAAAKAAQAAAVAAGGGAGPAPPPTGMHNSPIQRQHQIQNNHQQQVHIKNYQIALQRRIRLIIAYEKTLLSRSKCYYRCSATLTTCQYIICIEY